MVESLGEKIAFLWCMCYTYIIAIQKSKSSNENISFYSEKSKLKLQINKMGMIDQSLAINRFIYKN